MIKLKNYLLILILLTGFSCKQTQTNQKKTGQESKRDSIINAAETIAEHIPLPEIPERTINLIEYSGHEPDVKGSYDFRADIQRAIDELSAQGGGKLIFPHPKGKNAWIKLTTIYRVKGPIQLKSNIELSFEPSVQLFFEFAPENYAVNNKGVITRYEGTTIYSYSPLIRGFNVQNIAITAIKGNGATPEITGDGEKWVEWMVKGEAKRQKAGLLPSYKLMRKINNQDLPLTKRQYFNPDSFFLRPELIEFFLCKNVLIDGIKLSNSPFWVVHPVFSENCTFRNIIFDAENVNNDGFDPESSKNILIENIIFKNHDDNVAVKAGRDKEGREGAFIKGTQLEKIKSNYILNNRIGGPSENIVIRNCVFQGHNAVCIGSEMSGGANNIFAYNNVAPIGIVQALYLKSSRKRGGKIQNVFFLDLKANQIRDNVICMVPNYDNDTTSQYPPVFKNIYIENINVNQSSEGVLIYGWPDAPIKNVIIKDLKIRQTQKGEIKINQVKNVTLKNVNINEKEFNKVFHNVDPTASTPQVH